MKISRTGASTRQVAYARRTWGAKGIDKKHIALDVGYSPSVSNSVVSKIESRKGYHNAMAKLAAESNNLALSVLHQFKSRGLDDFSNKELISALAAISNAWERFNKGMVDADKPVDNGKNRLKTIVLQNINKQVNIQEKDPSPQPPIIEISEEPAGAPESNGEQATNEKEEVDDPGF